MSNISTAPGIEDQYVPPVEPVFTTRLSTVSLVLTTTFGLILTALLFLFSVRTDNERVQSQVQKSVDLIALGTMQATYLQPLTDALMGAFAKVQEALSDGVVTQEEMNRAVWNPVPAGLETTSVSFLPRITLDDVNDRTRLNVLLNGHENAGISLSQLDDAFMPAPATVRDEYFPVMLQSAPGETTDSIGLDRSNRANYRLAMIQARDTGILTSFASFPMGGEEGRFQMNYYYYPLFEGGVVPPTVAERREKLVGFASAVTRMPSATIAAVLPEAYHGMSALFVPALTPEELATMDDNIKAMVRHPDIKHAEYQMEGLHFNVFGKASPELVDAASSNTRWWILALGLMVTSWVSGMIHWHRQQSLKMMNVVKARTQDLAERTHALSVTNAALHQSERLYRMLADNVMDVIYTCDLDCMCTYVTPSIKHLTGRDTKDYMGALIYQYLPPDKAEQARRDFASLIRMAEGGHNPDELLVVHPPLFQFRAATGELKYVDSTVTLLFDDNRKPMGFLGVMRDVSEKKRAEAEKESLQEAYRQAQKMEAIGTLAGGIAHDFNNLLTGVLGHADILRLELGDQHPTAQRSIELIELAANRAKDLTSQLLGFARKGKFKLEAVEINQVLTEVIGLIDRTIDKNIDVVQVPSRNNPIITGDASQITQTILNLAINARDAMPGGGKLTLKTEARPVEGAEAINLGLIPGKYCIVTVADTGRGIEKEKLDRIFEPFFTDKEEGKGTGLGLAMVYGVVKNHKGAVSVQSEMGVGSIFKMYFPLSSATTNDRRHDHGKTLIKGTGNVLLVDDQDLVRKVGEKMLAQLGYNVAVAEDGVQGLQYYKQHWASLDVVIVDMIMPNMSGLECLEEMKKVNPNLRAILATGYSRDEISHKLNDSHIVGFMQKPYRLHELSKLIASATPSH